MDAAELRLLSLLLSAPEEASLDLLRELAADHPWLAEASAGLEDLSLDQWKGEHTRLFIAGFPRTPCPPFASAWVEKRMYGTPTEALQQFYARLGLEPKEMPADYLGTLLECAALLAEEPDWAPLEADLWRDHLLPWLSEFTTILARESRLRIYRVLAQRMEDVAHEYQLAIAAAGAA